MGRFDCSVKNATQFHDSIRRNVDSILDELYQHRKDVLGVKH
ncbi:MAG: hypothetical protein R2728_13480 [Chitinophagales bacterium]